MGVASSKAQLKSTAKKLRNHMRVVEREVKKLRARQEAHATELRAVKREAMQRLTTVLSWGALRVLPLFTEWAETHVRLTMATHALDRACIRALNSRLSECRALLSVVQAQLTALNQPSPSADTVGPEGTPLPISPSKDAVGPEFFVPPIDVISADRTTKLVRREVARLTQRVNAVRAKMHREQGALEKVDPEAARTQLVDLVEQERAAQEAARAADGSGAADGDGGAACPWAERQLVFDSIVTDQRDKLGRLLQRWCSRVLGVPGRLYLFGLDVNLDAVTVPGIPADLLLPVVRQPDFSPVVGVASAAGAGAGAAPSRPSSSAVLPTSSMPATPPRDASGKLAAPAAHSSAAAEVAMVPTPAVILAFIGYFTREVCTTFNLDKSAVSVLRTYVDRLVYPRIHTLCFGRLQGHDVLERRDQRWRSRVRVALTMSAVDIGIKPKLLGRPPATAPPTSPSPDAAAGPPSHRDAASPAPGRAVDDAAVPPAAASAPPTVPPALPPPSAAAAAASSSSAVKPPRTPVTQVAHRRLHATAGSPCDDGLFAAASQRLGRMESETIPSQMLAHLTAALDLAFQELAARTGDPTAGSKLDAESMMPLFVFIVSRSPLRRPHACLAYLANFGISAANSGGRAAYLITTAQAAVSWVCRLKLPRSLRRGPRALAATPVAVFAGVSAGAGTPAERLPLTAELSFTRRSSASSRGWPGFSDEESDGDDSYHPEAAAAGDDPYDMTDTLSPLPDDDAEDDDPTGSPTPDDPARAAAGGGTDGVTPARGAAASSGRRTTPQSVQFDAAIGALLRRRPSMVPPGLASDTPSAEDDGDAGYADDELDDYMREEGMPEDVGREADAEGVKELSMWLGQPSFNGCVLRMASVIRKDRPFPQSAEGCWRHYLSTEVYFRQAAADDSMPVPSPSKVKLHVPGVADPRVVVAAFNRVLALPAAAFVSDEAWPYDVCRAVRTFVGTLYDMRFGCQVRLIFYSAFDDVDRGLADALRDCTAPDKVTAVFEVIAATMLYSHMQPLSAHLLATVRNSGVELSPATHARCLHLLDALLGDASDRGGLGDRLNLPVAASAPVLVVDPTLLAEFATTCGATEPTSNLLRYMLSVAKAGRHTAVTRLACDLGVQVVCASPRCACRDAVAASGVATVCLPLPSVVKVAEAACLGGLWPQVDVAAACLGMGHVRIDQASQVHRFRKAIAEAHVAPPTDAATPPGTDAEPVAVVPGASLWTARPRPRLRERPDMSRLSFVPCVRRLLASGATAAAATLAGASEWYRESLLEAAVAHLRHMRRLAHHTSMSPYDAAREFLGVAPDYAPAAGSSQRAAKATLPVYVAPLHFGASPPPERIAGRPPCAVVCVRTVQGVAAMADALHSRLRADGSMVVGIDAEWRPSGMYHGVVVQRWPVSVLQVSTRRAAYIVDMLALHAEAQGDDNSSRVLHALDASIGWLLRHHDVTVVGYVANSDLDGLVASFPAWRSVFYRCTRYIELQNVPGATSLSAVVRGLLRRRMDKWCQTSDWQRRPLSRQQLTYAATDAYVLLEVYGELREPPAAVVLDITEVKVTVSDEAHYELLVHTGAHGGTGAAGEPTPASPPHVPSTPAAAPGATATPPSSAITSPAPAASASSDAGRGGATGAAGTGCASGAAAPPPTPPGGHLGTAAVVAVLERHGFSDRLLHVPPSPTAALAAAHVGVPEHRLIKSLNFMIKGEPVVVLVPGHAKVCTKSLAKLFGVSRSKTRFASAEQCVSVFGFMPGTVPPVGHKAECQVVLDSGVEQGVDLYFGGGDLTTLTRFTAAEIARITSATVAVVTVASATSGVTAAPATTTAAPPPSAGPPLAGAGAGGGGPAWGGDATPSTVRFLCDMQIGKLLKYLRLALGVDTTVAPRRASATELLAIAAAEGRVVLTRDAKVNAATSTVPVFVLPTDMDVLDQFRVIASHFGLTPRIEHAFSRCMRCNGTRFVVQTQEDVLDDSVPAKIQAYVRGMDMPFWLCATCRKLYWEEVPGVRFAALTPR